MSNQLPSLQALRAFESVARHLSFTKAAEELHVSKSAVSHQIKKLEEFLGFELIERNNTAIQLTGPAKKSLTKLSAGFRNIANAVELMRSHIVADYINIWVTPSFAGTWLLPRLNRFSRQHPHINLNIASSENLLTSMTGEEVKEKYFARQGADVLIRFSNSNYKGLRVKKLFEATAVPLCSPALVHHETSPLRSVNDLKNHTLIHDDTSVSGLVSWEKWLWKYGCTHVDVNGGLHFNQSMLALEAAKQGQGVVLSLEQLARQDINDNRLCIPFPNLKIQLENAFYVIYGETGHKTPLVNLFIEWLLKEANRDIHKAPLLESQYK